VVGQELQLKQNEQRDRAGDEADRGDRFQQKADDSGAQLARSAEKLDKDVARQLAAQLRSFLIFGYLLLQLGMERADLARQQQEMQQHIGMYHQKDDRSQYEEGLERQFDIEERQLDRALQQQIAVCDGTGRDGEI
jgi:hypothetical protein